MGLLKKINDVKLEYIFHPTKNTFVSFDSKLPQDFKKILYFLEKFSQLLHLDKFDSKDIPEILKICGQKLVKYHIENLMEDERKYWFVQAGRKG